MKKIFFILFFCTMVIACTEINSVHPFDDEQARIIIHHWYPQILKRPANKCVECAKCAKHIACDKK